MEKGIRNALQTDRTIDIITTGARTGLPRRTEIWFTNVGGRIIITGTPGASGGRGPRMKRDWLANLKANPDFTFCLKESLQAEMPARAVEIVDPEDRRYLMSAPETRWYRDQGNTVEALVAGSPIVEVFFREEGFLALLAAPARRALEGNGITTLEQLSGFSEAELLELHGFGPSSLPRLRSALAAKGLSFKTEP